MFCGARGHPQALTHSLPALPVSRVWIELQRKVIPCPEGNTGCLNFLFFIHYVFVCPPLLAPSMPLFRPRMAFFSALFCGLHPRPGTTLAFFFAVSKKNTRMLSLMFFFSFPASLYISTPDCSFDWVCHGGMMQHVWQCQHLHLISFIHPSS